MIHLEFALRTPLAKAAGWAILHSLWETAAVAAVLAVALAVLSTARTRYIAACGALCAVLLAFALTAVWYLPWESKSSAFQSPDGLAWRIVRSDPNFRETSRPALDVVLPWLTPFWAAGVILCYARCLMSWTAAQRLRRTGLCAVPEFWREKLDSLRGRLRLARPVALFESCLAEVPMVIGHAKPVILLPVGLLTGLPAVQLESILLHELEHVRRCDWLVNIFQSTAESVLFYHPLVWWISRVIRAEREHCCDDAAVHISGNARQYALALEALERNRWAASQQALAATGGSLVNRIHRLLKHGEGPRPALSPVWISAILLFAAAFGLMAWQTSKPDAPLPLVDEKPFVADGQSSPPPVVNNAYRKWLEEDVAYIIRPEERAVFLHLQTDAERQKFIEQFWLRRDPNPGTPENEFREEHYRRIAFANQHFAEPGKAGWKADRGRIYIVFGPPDERDEHPSGDTKRLYPFEVWRYRYIAGIGNDVFMEFADSTRSGNFAMTRDPHP